MTPKDVATATAWLYRLKGVQFCIADARARLKSVDGLTIEIGAWATVDKAIPSKCVVSGETYHAFLIKEQDYIMDALRRLGVTEDLPERVT